MFSQYRLVCDQANVRSCLLLLYFSNTAVVPNGEALSLAFYPKEAWKGHNPFLTQKDTVDSQLCTGRMVLNQLNGEYFLPPLVSGFLSIYKIYLKTHQTAINRPVDYKGET